MKLDLRTDWTDRQTDGQTDTHTYRERERERAFSTQNGLEGAVNNYV